MKHFLAIDQGTSSSRAIVFNEQFEIVSVAQEEFPLQQPYAGWVEQNPREILETVRLCGEKALREAAVPVLAVGITNQRETTILWNRETGTEIYPAIVWQDRRTARECELLRGEWGERILEKTGLIVDPYFSATKIAWILDSDPAIRAQAEAGEILFGTVDTYLLWQLSGRKLHVTDPSNASRTLLFNLHTMSWDEELLRIFRIPRAILPEVVPSVGLFGDIEIGGRDLPVTAVFGDQQAALFGQRCFSSGMAKNTYGTGCFLMLNLGPAPKISQKGLITTVAWQIGSEVTYAFEGSVFVAGAAVQWLRDGLGIISASEQVNELAEKVSDSDGVLCVPAMSGLGAPHWVPDAQGAMFGLTRRSNASHVARAMLEGIAFQTADVVSAMSKEAPVLELRVDGGAAKSDLLLQFQADILGMKLLRPESVESTALGAAYGAALGVGAWGTPEELPSPRTPVTHFLPKMDFDTRENRLRRWRAAVDAVIGMAQMR